MPKDHWIKKNQKDRALRLRKEPQIKNGSSDPETNHKQRLHDLVRSFSEKEGFYVKELKPSHMPSLSCPVDQQRTLLETGGETLRKAWPLYDLLSMLPEGDRAENVRKVFLAAEKGKYSIVIPASEYAQLKSALTAGKEI